MDTVFLHIRKRTITGDTITVQQLTQLTGAAEPLIEKLVEEEIITPRSHSEAGLLFTQEDVDHVERALRLHYDLGINWTGVAVIDQLLHQVEQLQQELKKRTYPPGEIQDSSIE